MQENLRGDDQSRLRNSSSISSPAAAVEVQRSNRNQVAHTFRPQSAFRSTEVRSVEIAFDDLVDFGKTFGHAAPSIPTIPRSHRSRPEIADILTQLPYVQESFFGNGAGIQFTPGPVMPNVSALSALVVRVEVVATEDS